MVQQGSAFASEGFDLILIAHGAMVEPAHHAGASNSRTCSSVCSLQPRRRRRVADESVLVDMAQHNANFMAGALAAMVI